MAEQRPDDIVVTGVAVDDPGTLDLTHEIAEAAGELTKDGSIVKVSVTLGDAILMLAYDEESEESATNAAVLLAGAGQLVAAVEDAYAEATEGSDD